MNLTETKVKRMPCPLCDGPSHIWHGTTLECQECFILWIDPETETIHESKLRRIAELVRR